MIKCRDCNNTAKPGAAYCSPCEVTHRLFAEHKTRQNEHNSKLAQVKELLAQARAFCARDMHAESVYLLLGAIEILLGIAETPE